MIISNILNYIYGLHYDSNGTGGGDYNAASTWAPNAAYPSGTGDTFAIRLGDVVKCNVVQTAELNACSVSGFLWFPTDANSKLTWGHVDLTLAAVSGTIITSTDGTINNIAAVASGYTCSLVWNTTADNAKGLIISQGAYIDMRGDNTLYGNYVQTTLQANWSAGQTFTVVGAGALGWKNGQTIQIHDNRTAGIASISQFTINTVAANGSNTDVTINEAAPGTLFNAGGIVYVMDRNVKVYKLGAETPTVTQVFTLRPRITDNHTTGTVKWTDVWFSGLYTYNGATVTAGTFSFTNCVNRSSYSTYNNLVLCTMTSCINQGYSSVLITFTNCTLSYCIVYGSSGTAYSTFTNCTLSYCLSIGNAGYGFSTVVGCSLTGCNSSGNGYAGFYTITSCNLTNCSASIISSSLYAGYMIITSCTLNNCTSFNNTVGFRQFQSLLINGSIGWNGAVSSPNTTSDFYFPSEIRTRNVKCPQAGYVYTSRNTTGVRGGVIFDDLNQSSGAWRFDGAFSTHTKVANPVGGGFMSGDGSCIKIEPLSNISATNYTWALGGYLKSQEEGLAIYVPARQVTIKCRVQSCAFDTLPTNAELYLEVLYYSDATTTMATVVSTETIAANDTTKVLTVTITPNRASKAYIRLVFTGPYDADGYILVDPCVNW